MTNIKSKSKEKRERKKKSKMRRRRNKLIRKDNGKDDLEIKKVEEYLVVIDNDN
jgi:hypothetical protein